MIARDLLDWEVSVFFFLLELKTLRKLPPKVNGIGALMWAAEMWDVDFCMDGGS